MNDCDCPEFIADAVKRIKRYREKLIKAKQEGKSKKEEMYREYLRDEQRYQKMLQRSHNIVCLGIDVLKGIEHLQ